MAAPSWVVPDWIREAPKSVDYSKEASLLKSFADQAGRFGLAVVPASQLDFDSRQFADLVLERMSDSSRLYFGLTQKGSRDPARIDIQTRPKPGHAELIYRNGEWRVVLGSTFLHPEAVSKMGLGGLVQALLDERA
jgi:hypothetical protein